LSPDAFFSLTRPQMLSIGCPDISFLTARFISSNSADSGSTRIAAVVAFALFTTASSVSLDGPGTGVSGAGLITGVAFFPIKPVWSVEFDSDRAGTGTIADFVLAGRELVLSATRLISVCGLAVVL